MKSKAAILAVLSLAVPALFWVTPASATTIIVDPDVTTFTAADVQRYLDENAQDLDRVGSTLTIRVQNTIASSTTTSATKSNGVYTSVRSKMYLKAVNSTFSIKPDATFAHEYGHAWSQYHRYMDHNGDWTSYLEARGLYGDARLNTSYGWSVAEIIADDYRLCFGSTKAISQFPNHMNRNIPHPTAVAGLCTFLESY